MKYKSLLRNVEYNSSVEDNRIVTVPNDYVNNDDDCELIFSRKALLRLPLKSVTPCTLQLQET